MTLHHLNRRVHLYLALFLLPWFLLYGISSIPFSHNQYFEQRDRAKGIPMWTQRFERSYDTAIPEGPELRAWAGRVMKDAGLDTEGSYGAYRQSPTQVNIYVYTFWKSTQLKYFVADKRLVCEDRRFRWDQFLTGMHAKGGFEQGGWHDVWGVVVDLVCLGMILWVFTGVAMWWSLPFARIWGWAALGSGVLSFVWFLWRL